MTKNTAQLGAGLIVTKGSASPSIELPNSSHKNTELKEKRIALTFKISDSDYKKLKIVGIEKGMSTQSVLDLALSDYLIKNT